MSGDTTSVFHTNLKPHDTFDEKAEDEVSLQNLLESLSEEDLSPSFKQQNLPRNPWDTSTQQEFIKKDRGNTKQNTENPTYLDHKIQYLSKIKENSSDDEKYLLKKSAIMPDEYVELRNRAKNLSKDLQGDHKGFLEQLKAQREDAEACERLANQVFTKYDPNNEVANLFLEKERLLDESIRTVTKKISRITQIRNDLNKLSKILIESKGKASDGLISSLDEETRQKIDDLRQKLEGTKIKRLPVSIYSSQEPSCELIISFPQTNRIEDLLDGIKDVTDDARSAEQEYFNSIQEQFTLKLSMFELAKKCVQEDPRKVMVRNQRP